MHYSTKKRRILRWFQIRRINWKNPHDKKVIPKNLLFYRFIIITFYWFVFSQFCLQIWNKHEILRFLVPILTYLKKKVFISIFWKILFSVVLPWSGEGEGYAKFLLKCHALCPICRTSFVVHKSRSSLILLNCSYFFALCIFFPSHIFTFIFINLTFRKYFKG